MFGEFPKAPKVSASTAKSTPKPEPTASPAHHRKRKHRAASAETAASPSPAAAAASPAATPAPTAAPSETPKPSKSRKGHGKRRHSTRAAESPEPSPQATAAPAPTATPAPTVAPTPESTSTPAPTVAPTPTAAPTPKGKKGRKSKHGKPTPTPDAGGLPQQADATPASPLSEPNPFVPTPAAPGPDVESEADHDAQERTKFNAVKAKALEDDSVLGLKEKMDTASSADEQAKASKVFYKALYNKMRNLDPSLKERIDRMQALTSKRLEENP